LEVWEGNRRRALGELFEVSGEAGGAPREVSILVLGDVSRVRRVGEAMSAGRIAVEGSVGMHLGEAMKGGAITVAGDAGSWAGSMMVGGTIEVMGNAGDYVGAPIRGGTSGMRGGAVVVHGDAGSEVGCFMRGGVIRVHGGVGQFAGIHMRDGSILVLGDSEGRAGAEMTGGRIVLCGFVPSVLPTFTIDDVRPSVKVDAETVEGPFYRFVGDLAEGGDGKLYVSKAKNPHLNAYEKYLQNGGGA